MDGPKRCFDENIVRFVLHERCCLNTSFVFVMKRLARGARAGFMFCFVFLHCLQFFTNAAFPFRFVL